MTPLLVHVTASSFDEARRIAGAVLENRLAACANLVPGIESHYRWQGRLEQAGEVLILMKSSAELFPALEACVKSCHSYECPEIVAVPVIQISSDYRQWWEENLHLGA
jgi:periplasmic divalent cation tolerance protein